MHGREFVAIPAGSWYNFNKIAQYKQLTLEEAEEKMNKRKHNATGYERWMMKAATNGAAAFGEMKNSEGFGGADGWTEGTRPKKAKVEENGDHSDRGEEDEELEESRKNRLGLNRKGGDDDEDGGKGDDMDDDDIEKGDDWEHEEIFTDDDEAVGNDPEEREDLAPEIPAPPEIKQDEDDEIEGEEEGGLSKSGKELKKLLGKAAGLNESDVEEDDDDDDMDDETTISPVLAPKQKDAPKDEPADNSPLNQLPVLFEGHHLAPSHQSQRKRLEVMTGSLLQIHQQRRKLSHLSRRRHHL
ncbi:Transcription initiation factor IIF subunit alpha [Platanthera guangdongensis]|uniref:Transcription initiation factor IIF subunit alpha n=1 Tax=Platanthera guangdongensis TaxID=2320717 RepID=A0ABR2LD18_9ASPA